MFLKLKLEGSGKPRDEYRVNLPTYTFLHGNISQGYALVLVPDEVHGLTDEDLKDETHEDTTEGPLYTSLSQSTLDKLHANLDARYKEHKGKFRVEAA